MNKFFKEFILWVFIALPYVYLKIVWDELPDKVPTHFNADGEPNDWSSKNLLLFLPGILGMGIYFLMIVIPAVDPKKRILQMGDKYYTLRFFLSMFICLLVTYLIHASKTGSIKNPYILFIIIGGLFAVLGNYFQTVRPNYFIGIRTPWTLENEVVWKKTHRLAGKVWIVGGILIALLSVIIKDNQLYSMIFTVVIFIMVLVPVIFSYTEFRKEKRVVNK